MVVVVISGLVQVPSAGLVDLLGIGAAVPDLLLLVLPDLIEGILVLLDTIATTVGGFYRYRVLLSPHRNSRAQVSKGVWLGVGERHVDGLFFPQFK